METLKAIAKRRSTRAYKPEQIPEEALNVILAAGCAAPVGKAKYDTLHLTVVQDPALLGKINEAASKMMNAPNPVYGAPTLIIVSAAENPVPPTIEVGNASCIVENMLLAATDAGIDSVYLWGAAKAAAGDPALLGELKIPAGFKPVICAALGYAVKSPEERELKISISMNRV